MKTIEDFTMEDFSRIADKAIRLNKTTSEDELYQMLGSNLSKLTVPQNKSLPYVEVRSSGLGQRHISGTDTMGLQWGSHKELFHVPGSGGRRTTRVLSIPARVPAVPADGKEFFEKFRHTIGKVICNSSTIIDFIKGNGSYTIKDLLVAIIPIIFTAIGIVVLNSVMISIIAGILALIIKSGFQSYCSIYVEKA